MKTNCTTANIPSQVGRTALITGSNSGIGFETALALARQGAELILPARTQAKADDAAVRILGQVPNAQVHTEILDLAVQASVRAFASRVIQRFPGHSLDLLINNAGVTALPAREVTADGFERQFATNYLGCKINIERSQILGRAHARRMSTYPVHGSRGHANPLRYALKNRRNASWVLPCASRSSERVHLRTFAKALNQAIQ